VETILPQNQRFDYNYGRVEHANVTLMWQTRNAINARPIQNIAGQERIIPARIEDVTELKKNGGATCKRWKIKKYHYL